MDRSDGTVDELKILESVEGFECGDGQCDVVGAVREAEGKEVAKGFGSVAAGGVVEGWLRAGVFGSRNIKGLECSLLFRVEC